MNDIRSLHNKAMDLFELGLTDKMEAEAVTVTQNIAATPQSN